MNSYRFSRWTAVVLTTAGVLVVSGAVAAQAATAPRWEPSFTSAADGFASITATAPNAAWAVGTGGKTGWAPYVVRWNGSRWRSMPAPGGPEFDASQVQATGPADVWVFGTAVPSGTPEAFNWNGSAWHPVTTLPDPVFATVLSSSDVWGYGGGECGPGSSPVCTSQIWHWSNGTVATYNVKGVVAGMTRAGSSVRVLMQVAIKDMNGPSMSSLPAIYVGAASGLHKMAAPKGRIGVFPQIAASSRGNIWLLAPALSRHKAGYLDYWNGHTWSSRAIPDRLTIYSWGFSYDYHSGVWLSPYAHWTGRRWVATNPAGPTSQYELNYVAAIPGSASTWAIAFSGAHVGKRTYLGMIALNGKRP